MKYHLLEAEDAGALSEKVTRALDNGWTLYGNPIAACDDGEYVVFAQAIVKQIRINPMSQS